MLAACSESTCSSSFSSEFYIADLEELVLEQLSSSRPCFWILVQALTHHLPQGLHHQQTDRQSGRQAVSQSLDSCWGLLKNI